MFNRILAGTPYAGGFFRVKLILGKDFPQTPPKAFFLTKIFHPNVAPNGEICVNTLKKDWKPDLGIKHILLVSICIELFMTDTFNEYDFGSLQTVKCLLIVPNAESALNEEAGKLLLEHYDDYSSRAKMMTEIHAQAERTSKALKMDSESIGDDGPQSKKHASDSRATNGQDKRKDKLGKDKKRVLKRLWDNFV